MKRINVFSDGETWELMEAPYSPSYVMDITDDAYEALCDGERPSQLRSEDVLRDWSVALNAWAQMGEPDGTFNASKGQ